jgi:predicted signal transduction protein with EAL and GGDEF domain
MWIYDVQTLRFLEANESAIRQYGYTREEFLSLALNDILLPQDAPVVQEFFQVGDMDEASRSYPIVQAIIAMGHRLQMRIIAEGVEHEDQIKILRDLNCDCMQGFLFSRPASPDNIAALLAIEHNG